MLNCGLFGTLAAQVCEYISCCEDLLSGIDPVPFFSDSYHMSFPNDPLTHKLLVYTVLVLGTVQTILVVYDRYVALVLGFGDALAQEAIGMGWFYVPLLSGICRCSVSTGSPVFDQMPSWWHSTSFLCPPYL